MSDESFIREVNEEIRQEKAKALWGSYGPYLILAAVFLVLATGAYQIYDHWQASKAGHVGDSFLLGLDLASTDKFDESMKKLDDVEKSGFGDYPFLAQLRKASLSMEEGDPEKAVAGFDAVANNKSAPEILQKVAKIRAAYILVDTGQFEDVEKRVKDLATDVDPVRIMAREALGLSAYKAGKMDEALYYFKKIVDEGLDGIKATERSRLMLELMQGDGIAAKG
ncbi:tetratricopeptide repeat protein [uncultured Bartonella sp.]|uniref:tetratricopeptide repeat protein n=1 Tax=uncultured Bartonella sp. TaxID=104108 RepID=UPI0026366BCF|nr:tetratricopeptide repeat protein [uncultured Bartonella sp.]